MNSVKKKVTVILLSRIKNLGKRGDVLTVSLGLWRNYLRNKGFAVPYDPEVLSQLNKSHVENPKHKLLSGLLEGKSIYLVKQANSLGVLFNSVRKEEIKNKLINEIPEELQDTLNNSDVFIKNPIKHIGKYELEIFVGEEVSKIHIVISTSEDRNG